MIKNGFAFYTTTKNLNFFPRFDYNTVIYMLVVLQYYLIKYIYKLISIYINMEKPLIVVGEELKNRLKEGRQKSVTYEDVIWGLYWGCKASDYKDKHQKVSVIYKTKPSIIKNGWIQSVNQNNLILLENPTDKTICMDLLLVGNILPYQMAQIGEGEKFNYLSSPSLFDIEEKLEKERREFGKWQ